MMTDRRALLLSALALSGCAPTVVAPAVPAPLTVAPAGARAFNAPIAFVAQRPVVMLTVDGRGPFAFILDTGADVVGVSDAFASEMKLADAGQVRTGSGYGEDVMVDTVRLPGLSLGEQSLGPVTAQIVPLPPGVVGILGPNAFASHGRVLIDLPAATLTLGGATGAEGGWLAFGETAPLLDVPVQLPGGATVMAHADTGATHAFAVPTGAETSLTLTGPAKVIGRARTIDKEFEVRLAPMDGTIRFSGAQVHLPDVRIIDAPIANLGMGVLRFTRIEYDFPGRRFAIRGGGRAAAWVPKK